MPSHEHIHKLVEAERVLMCAREICTCAAVIDQIDKARDLVYDAGDLLCPEIIKEIRESKIDPTM